MPRKSKSGAEELRTIKIRVSTHERIQALIAQLAREGWRSVDVDRQDAPAVASIVDAALGALEGRRRR